jgi:iron complex transport system ATP-binding protein
MWDKRAKQFNESMMQHRERTEKQIAKIELNSEGTVLDVGAGTGRIAIPIAKHVESVTAIEAIELIGLADIADRPYTALSGGQRQLVLLARAFAQGTKILLLDEPTSNLDFQNQIMIWRIIKELTKKGISALTCTHDPNHVSWFCDKVIVLGNNGIVANGNPAKALTEETLNEIYGGVCSVKSFDGMQMVIPRGSGYSASTNTVEE